MFTDARLPDLGPALTTDVCIVGAGPAGLLLAHQLANKRLKVCVLEGGDQGAGSDEPLETGGSQLEPLAGSRTQQVGGTAALWNAYIRGRPGARYLRFSKIDFETREWLPYSGWPFDLHILEPFYLRAERLVMPPVHRDPACLEDLRAMPFQLDPRAVVTSFEHFGTRDVFTDRLPRWLARRPNVAVLTNASVTRFLTNNSGTEVESALVNGGALRVSSKVFILACGGIANARLLLLSGTSERTALGNGRDLVGRFFMDHHRVEAGRLTPSDPGVFERAAAYDLRAENGRHVMAKLTIAPEVLRGQHILDSSTLLWPKPAERDDIAVDAARPLLRRLLHGNIDKTTGTLGVQVLRGSRYLASTAPRLAVTQRHWPPDISRGGWSSLPNNRRRFTSFQLVQQCEQSPQAENRVTLSTTLDASGLPAARVESHWSNLDLESIRVGQAVLGQAFETAGIGSLRPPSEPFPSLHQEGGMHHHLGTTRMHRDPAWGVVDENCRVHGTTNLFVAGSSVFPTGGFANPTLTILALAIRLADHLKEKLHLSDASVRPG